MLVMNHYEPGRVSTPHRHEFDQNALITARYVVRHAAETGHNVGPGSILLITAEAERYIESGGHEAIQDTDVFSYAREDYFHPLEWMGRK